MSFLVGFATDNAAFEYSQQTEVARILRVIADRIEKGEMRGPAMDINGNKVGEYELEV
jgi:hypothetical protein